MVKLLPFIAVPVLILGGLWYWRTQVSKQVLTTPQVSTLDSSPVEVPKTLPNASLEDRVKALEETVTKLVTQINSLKSSALQTSVSNPLDGGITELKARVSALEKVAPAPAAGSKSTVYIPLGGSAGPWGSQDWNTVNEYEVSLNPDNYPGYTGMNLEVTFRLTESAGTGSVRLYNSTDGSATSSQLDTTSSTFSLQSSSSFKLATGTKTYKLQVKSSQGKDLVLQSARIKVNF